MARGSGAVQLGTSIVAPQPADAPAAAANTRSIPTRDHAYETGLCLFRTLLPSSSLPACRHSSALWRSPLATTSSALRAPHSSVASSWKKWGELSLDPRIGSGTSSPGA